MKHPSFRVHCVGDGQPNTVPQVGRTGLPEIGQDFAINLTNARAVTPCVLMFGLSRTVWAGGSLPWSLRVLGAPGCSLLQSADLKVTGLTTDAAGAAALSTTLPNRTGLVGATLHCQWYLVDPGNNSANLAVTPAGRAVVGG